MSEAQQPEPLKPFGLGSATFLVIANMVGAGVFTTSGFSLADLGDRSAVMLAWTIGAFVALCGAISYGQLSQRITQSGGEYVFLSRFVHHAIGFVAGWVSLLAGFTGAIAFAAITFESYAVPDSIRPSGLWPGLVATITIALFAMLHALVLKVGVVTQNLVVLIKLLLLVGFVMFAFWKFPLGWEGMQVETEPRPFSILALASTLVWISLSFSGFNAAVYVTEEIQDPQKNVPRALIMGTAFVACLYLILNFVFLYGPRLEEIKGVQDVAAAAAQSLGGHGLATVIRVVVSVAMLSSVSSMVIAGPRVYAKMADDGLFPNFFTGEQRGKYVVPSTAIALQAALACLVVMFSTLKSLLDYLGFTLSVSAAVTVACIVWTKRQQDHGMHRLVYSSIALIYVGSTVILATLSAINRPQQLIGFVLTLGSGLVLYVMFSANHPRKSGGSKGG